MTTRKTSWNYGYNDNLVFNLEPTVKGHRKIYSNQTLEELFALEETFMPPDFSGSDYYEETFMPNEFSQSDDY
jgi:hypothetical protein